MDAVSEKFEIIERKEEKRLGSIGCSAEMIGDLDMILSGREIERAVGTDIIIEPFERSKVNPNSYNLTLHNELLVYENEILDMKKPNPTKKLVIPEEGLLLEPNKLYLGRTKEFTTTSKYVPMLEGRSSTGRLGLCIHVTAGFGDIGFAGYWTLKFIVFIH